jgi:hypothetical protein
MKFLYEAIPFALGCLAGQGIHNLFLEPRDYMMGVSSILISILCLLGWVHHKMHSRTT